MLLYLVDHRTLKKGLTCGIGFAIGRLLIINLGGNLKLFALNRTSNKNIRKIEIYILVHLLICYES